METDVFGFVEGVVYPFIIHPFNNNFIAYRGFLFHRLGILPFLNSYSSSWLGIASQSR